MTRDCIEDFIKNVGLSINILFFIGATAYIHFHERPLDYRRTIEYRQQNPQDKGRNFVAEDTFGELCFLSLAGVCGGILTYNLRQKDDPLEGVQ